LERVGEKSFGDYLMMSPGDVPTISALKAAVERLKKDAALLESFHGRNDADPKDLVRVSSFLEMLLVKYRKQLKS
jgi:hypothetical protein